MVNTKSMRQNQIFCPSDDEIATSMSAHRSFFVSCMVSRYSNGFHFFLRSILFISPPRTHRAIAPANAIKLNKRHEKGLLLQHAGGLNFNAKPLSFDRTRDFCFRPGTAFRNHLFGSPKVGTCCRIDSVSAGSQAGRKRSRNTVIGGQCRDSANTQPAARGLPCKGLLQRHAGLPDDVRPSASFLT